MKKIIIMMLALVAMLAGHNMMAQKVLNDPSYSVHNYKHPNKAAYMKRIQDQQPVIYLEEVKDGQEENNSISQSDYKRMNASNSKIKKFRRVKAPVSNPGVAPASIGNYKQQFAPRMKKSEPKTQNVENIPVV